MAYSTMGSRFGQKPFADFGKDAKYFDQAERSKQKIAEKDRAYANEVQLLTSRLQSLIDTYGQSENPSDREMANIYAGYLRDLSKGGNDAYRVVNQYRKGYLPGLGRSGGETAPAWS